MKMTAMRFSLFIGLVLAVPLNCALAQQDSTQQDSTINDKDMNVISFEDLNYPAVAGSGSHQGVVVIEVKLDDQGKVVEAIAISGSPLLTRASVDNAKKWRFEPNPQKAAVIVYNFRIEGTCRPGDWSSQMIFYPPNFAAITACGRTTEP